MSPSITFAASATTSPKSTQHSVYTRPAKKPKMSITQTYYLAHSARGKLSKEAARPDHDLRLLVGHANMLDSLMIDLANAEQEQERWFNSTVTTTDREDEEVEEEEEEGESTPEDLAMEDADSDWEIENIHDDISDDEEGLQLVRTTSRSNSPPELTVDSDSDSEDEHMPASPPEVSMMISEKERTAIATTSFYETKEATLSTTEAESFEQDGFFIPTRTRPTIIAAC